MRQPSTGTLQKRELAEQVSVKQSLSPFVNCEKRSHTRRQILPQTVLKTCEKRDQRWLGWVCQMLKHIEGCGYALLFAFYF